MENAIKNYFTNLNELVNENITCKFEHYKCYYINETDDENDEMYTSFEHKCYTKEEEYHTFNMIDELEEEMNVFENERNNIENKENNKPKVYQTFDEIKCIYNRNNYKCCYFDTIFNINEMVVDENVIYIMFKNRDSNDYFTDKNKDKDEQYNIILFYKNKMYFRKTKRMTEYMLLSIFESCIICNDENRDTMNCVNCGKAICETCVNTLYKYDKNLKCPACRKSLV